MVLGDQVIIEEEESSSGEEISSEADTECDPQRGFFDSLFMHIRIRDLKSFFFSTLIISEEKIWHNSQGPLCCGSHL